MGEIPRKRQAFEKARPKMLSFGHIQNDIFKRHALTKVPKWVSFYGPQVIAFFCIFFKNSSKR
jgi:hypothetical protein